MFLYWIELIIVGIGAIVIRNMAFIFLSILSSIHPEQVLDIPWVALLLNRGQIRLYRKRDSVLPLIEIEYFSLHTIFLEVGADGRIVLGH